MENIRFIIIASLVCLLGSCSADNHSLPILGPYEVTGKDTMYATVASFSFLDQDSNLVDNAAFRDKIYVADFIFLSCPTLCPKMTGVMQSVYSSFVNDDRVSFISHTIDPDHDSIPRLKSYAGSLGVSALKWHFVTGNKDSILHLSEHSYFTIAYPDSTSPGGFTHSGALLLVDRRKHLRGVYNALDKLETERLKRDIHILLQEQF